MRLVDSSGNPISSGKFEENNPDDYSPEFIGSVFALVNKLTQKPEASFLFLSEAKIIGKLTTDKQQQGSLMSIVASYAAFTYATKVKKLSQEEFQKLDASALKDEMLTKVDIMPLGSLPFDALFELNPEMLNEIGDLNGTKTD